jgi:hypothetical protein
MKLNVGNLDRIVRIVLAAVIAVLFLTKVIEGTLGIILLIVGGVFLVTAIIGVCPIWLLLNVNTRKKVEGQ